MLSYTKVDCKHRSLVTIIHSTPLLYPTEKDIPYTSHEDKWSGETSLVSWASVCLV